jgi:hypothetical protein
MVQAQTQGPRPKPRPSLHGRRGAKPGSVLREAIIDRLTVRARFFRPPSKAPADATISRSKGLSDMPGNPDKDQAELHRRRLVDKMHVSGGFCVHRQRTKIASEPKLDAD